MATGLFTERVGRDKVLNVVVDDDDGNDGDGEVVDAVEDDVVDVVEDDVVDAVEDDVVDVDSPLVRGGCVGDGGGEGAIRDAKPDATPGSGLSGSIVTRTPLPFWLFCLLSSLSWPLPLSRSSPPDLSPSRRTLSSARRSLPCHNPSSRSVNGAPSSWCI